MPGPLGFLPRLAVVALLGAGCGQAPGVPGGGRSEAAPVAAHVAAHGAPDALLPNLPYRFGGPQILVFRFDVPASKVRRLVSAAFSPVVRQGKSEVYAIVSEYDRAGLPGLPLAGLRAREITYTVMCDRTGPDRDRKGFASFAIVEDRRIFTWLVRDVGYPATTAPLPWVRQGDRLTSQGEADLAVTRKTDALSHIERTASLTALLVGKHDHLAHGASLTQVPFLYPTGLLDGYGIRMDRVRFGTLERLGLVEPGARPADAWWWENVDFLVGQRKTYPAASRAM